MFHSCFGLISGGKWRKLTWPRFSLSSNLLKLEDVLSSEDFGQAFYNNTDSYQKEVCTLIYLGMPCSHSDISQNLLISDVCISWC